MRTSLITGALLAAVAAILVLPALSARSARRDAAAAGRENRAEDAARPARPALPAGLERAADHARRGEWERVISSAASVVPDSQRITAMRDLLIAQAHWQEGRAAEAAVSAESAMKAASKAEPVLRARAAFTSGQALVALDQQEAALTAFGVAMTDGLPALSARARQESAALLAATDPPRALALLAPLADEPGARPEMLASAAHAAEAAGEPLRARSWLRRLRFEHPTSADARIAAGHPLLDGEPKKTLEEGRAKDLLDRADALLEADIPTIAALDITVALAEGVPASHAARLEQLAGRLARAKGQHDKALVHLAKAAKSQDAVGCRAALHAARVSAARKRSGDAASWLERAAGGCPCESRDRAALELASKAEKAGQDEAARAHLARVAATGIGSAREQAAWRIAWADWSAGRKDEALRGFDSLAQATPQARQAAAARYWSARHLRERGDAEAARARLLSLASDFPREWYGLLAADEVGLELPSLPECQEEDIALGMAGQASALLGGGEPLRGFLDLEELGLVDDVLAEADAAGAAGAAGAGVKERAALRTLILSRAGRSREALREFRRAVPDWRQRADVPTALACAAWPVEHGELILESALEKKLEPSLVFGLVHQESVFDARAISHAGARGLMQVMPATGQTIARWLGERVTTPRLLEPELNVRYGTTYLRRLLDESGRVEVALAGYNAGPGRARRWWAVAGDDIPAFVENIPFDETRDYVKAIAVNERLYRTRLADLKLAHALREAEASSLEAGQ